MKANQLMTRDVLKCARGDSLEQAAGTMWEADTGCLVVTDSENRPVGMITDRDIAMAAYTQGIRLSEAAVESAMAHDVKTCRADSSIGDAEELMRSAQIRRLPVVDSAGSVLGILTLGDIARSSQSSPLRAGEIPGVAKTLAMVTQRREVAAAAE